MHIHTDKHISAITELESYFPSEDILTSIPHRLLYAHDASAYRIIPIGIVFPKSHHDIQYLMQWATTHGIGLTFRSAGTSLSGQAVGDGLIVDCSKYWKYKSYDEKTLSVTVETGIIGGHVNRFLSKHDRKIGPDPASIHACMMGGILANNASGMCCGIEHNSYHTIENIECILSNGMIFETSDPDADNQLMIQAPELHAGLMSIRKSILDSETLPGIIRRKYRLKNTVGYCLNAFLDESRPSQILKRLLIGSEGTLGFIAKATLHTLPSLPFASTSILFFNSMEEACSVIPLLSETRPDALEIMDRNALRSVAHQKGAPSLIQSLGQDGTGILIEYQAESNDSLKQKLVGFSTILHLLPLLEQPIFTEDPTLRNQYWSIRKGMFPSVGASRAKGTGIINEDIAVPIASLADAVKDLRALFVKYEFHEAIIFGHAKEGNLHFVIAHAFDTDEDIKAFGSFMSDLASLIIDTYGGSMKAEHGTGRNIAPFVAHEWGDEAYSIMKQLKTLFDPHSILNPGIIISDDPHAHTSNLKPFPIVNETIDTCIECGYCESRCPTHHSTLSPRQRIILDREIALADNLVLQNTLIEFAEYHQIDSCATDGLCSITCPVKINTGDYMLQKRSKRIEASTTSYVHEAKNIAKRDTTIRLKLNAGRMLANIIGGNTLQRVTSFIANYASIPQWIPKMPEAWNKKIHSTHNPDIIYLPSCTTRLFAKPQSENSSLPELIMELARKANIGISIPKDINERCCGLAYASKGDEASALVAMNGWKKSIHPESIVMTDAYSCHTHMMDVMNTIDILDFAEMIIKRLNITPMKGTAILHAPCSLQMQNGIDRLRSIAKHCAENVFIPESIGCCGFAGDHGFLHPELVVHACKEMKNEISQQSDVIGYYSINPTCELGMQIGTGNEYASILYLIQKAMNS